MREALPELREALPGVRLVLAAMGPKMCALAGAEFDGAFFNWMTPEFAAGARDARSRPAPREAGRETPPVFGYVRTAVGADAAERLAKEESFYRDLHDGYRNHFDRLGEPEGTVGVAAADARRRPDASSPPTPPSTRSSSAAWPAPSVEAMTRAVADRRDAPVSGSRRSCAASAARVAQCDDRARRRSASSDGSAIRAAQTPVMPRGQLLRAATAQYGGRSSYHSPRILKARQKRCLAPSSSSESSMSGV